MKKLFLLFLFFGLFSCSESDIEQIEPEQQGTATNDVATGDVAIDASGREYPFLDPPSYQYCGHGWGKKFCRFFRKYDGTIWADSENYYSDFSDIKFSNYVIDDLHFISFFNFDRITSYCEGWKIGENTYDGIKWDIEIKRDQEDVLWFDYDYYGASEEIEYTITYKYEVIDGLLHFSSSDDKTFIFHPSEKNYSKDAIDTGEIMVLEGCLF